MSTLLYGDEQRHLALEQTWWFPSSMSTAAGGVGQVPRPKRSACRLSALPTRPASSYRSVVWPVLSSRLKPLHSAAAISARVTQKHTPVSPEPTPQSIHLRMSAGEGTRPLCRDELTGPP